jgi:hypothetical protein
MKHKESPFDRERYIGTRSRYVSVEGVSGVTNEGELIRDNVFIKREERYDKKKFVKFYVEEMTCLASLNFAGIIMFIILVNEMDYGKSYIWLSWSEGYEKEYKISRTRFSRGVKELCNSNILAKSEQIGKYWINLNIVNRGN